MAGEVGVEDVDVGRVAELGRHLVLGRGLVADQTDNEVLGLRGDLLDQLELGSS